MGFVADKHTEAVVRQANARRQAQYEREVERAATPLLAWGGVAEPAPEPPAAETVEDRLAMRLVREERSFWKYTVFNAASEAALVNKARWYAYLCSLHPAAPPGLFETLMDPTFGPPLALAGRARKTYARLIEDFPVADDFENRPAPWFDIRRKHWHLCQSLPEEERKTGAWKAAMEAEIAAWQAEHPEETATWQNWWEERKAREQCREVVAHDKKYAA